MLEKKIRLSIVILVLSRMAFSSSPRRCMVPPIFSIQLTLFSHNALGGPEPVLDRPDRVKSLRVILQTNSCASHGFRAVPSGIRQLDACVESDCRLHSVEPRVHLAKARLACFTLLQASVLICESRCSAEQSPPKWAAASVELRSPSSSFARSRTHPGHP